MSGSWPVLNWISQVCPPLLRPPLPPSPPHPHPTPAVSTGLTGILKASPCRAPRTSGSVWTAAKESRSVPAEAPGGLASVLTLHAAGLPLCSAPRQAEWTLCAVTGGGDGGCSGCGEPDINNETKTNTRSMARYFVLFHLQERRRPDFVIFAAPL